MSAASDTQVSHYQFDTVSGTPVIRLEETLSQANVGVVETVGTELVEKLSAAQPKNLMVDITSMSYIGSALVALVVRMWKSVKDNGGRTVVAVGSPAVQEVLTIARLHEHWELVPTQEAGFKKLGLRAGSSTSDSAAPGSNATTSASPSRSTGSGQPVLAVFAVLGIVGAACGAVLLGTNSPLVAPMLALQITIGSAVVGLIAGAVMLTVQGGNKVVGVIAVVACGASVLAALALYRPAEPAPEGAAVVRVLDTPNA